MYSYIVDSDNLAHQGWRTSPYATQHFPVLSVRHDPLVSLDSGAALQTAQHGMGVNRTIVGLMAVSRVGKARQARGLSNCRHFVAILGDNPR